MRSSLLHRFLTTALFGLVFFVAQSEAFAVVRVSQIATLQGETRVRLSGVGLVIGLKAGNGDGPNPFTVAAYKKFLSQHSEAALPLEVLQKHCASVACVSITAEVPTTGIRAGQFIDCQVSAMFAAKSLANGELLQAPLKGEDPENDTAIALATGKRVEIEDQLHQTVGLVRDGCKMLHDIQINRLTRRDEVRLLLHPSRASAELGREVMDAVNKRFEVEAKGEEIAFLVSDAEIRVKVPLQYSLTPTTFISHLKEVTLKEPQKPTIRVNRKTGTVIVSTDVEIRPTAFSHKNLSVTVPDPFIGVQEPGKGTAPQRLSDLVESLNRLKIPSADLITVLHALCKNGSLQADWIED